AWLAVSAGLACVVVVVRGARPNDAMVSRVAVSVCVAAIAAVAAHPRVAKWRVVAGAAAVGKCIASQLTIAELADKPTVDAGKSWVVAAWTVAGIIAAFTVGAATPGLWSRG